ncbi:MAG: hypothetical protein Q8W44_06275 [Candidatus Palauibacterales bacterium]|nr:hypothetical protein [Candidatus Palauibacterales bacterium]
MNRTTPPRLSVSARWSAAAAALAVTALLLPAPAAGQESAEEIFRTAIERNEARLEGVDSVTVVQEITLPMGMTRQQELRLEKTTRDGRTLLVPAGEDDGSQLMPAASMMATMDSAMAASALRGRSEVDGHEVYVVAVPELPAIDFGQGALSGRSAQSFRGDSATFYVDADQYVLRRARVHGQMTMGGSERAVQVGVHLSDYRETGGYLHPFRSEVQLDIEGMEKQMQAMMQRMQQGGSDSAQRAMMEQAMAAMMGGGMTVVSTVKEVRVNGSRSSGG